MLSILEVCLSFTGSNRRQNFDLRFLLFLMIGIATNVDAFAEGANEGVTADKNFGLTHFIEDEQTADVFLSTVYLYGYLNNLKIIYNGRAKSGILAISMSDAIVNGKYNYSKIVGLSNNDREILSSFSVSGEFCSVGRVTSGGQGAENDNERVIVVFNNREDSVNDQLRCLFLGFLMSIGEKETDFEEAVNLSAKELIEKILYSE